MANKDEIIATASRLFVEKGFEKTTMEDIAHALNIHKGSLYYHINSKAEIFYEILKLSLKESSKKLVEVRRSKMGPEEKLMKILAVHFKNIHNYSLEYQILLNERRHMLDRKQEKYIRTKMKAYENHIFEILKEGIDAKVFREDLNPRIIVAGIMGVGNAFYKWFSFDGPLSFDEVADIYIELFLSGIKREN
ncbi:MAG: TetR family transcriptional regulator [Deltaproteobacteria bacterium]|nr:TetR family transcriptional regulator [Deltaproteobacteria bacterium]